MRWIGKRCVLPEIAALGVGDGGNAKSVIGVLRAARAPQIAIEGGPLKAPSAKLGLMTTGSKPIWRVQATPEQMMERSRNTLAERIGIRVTEIGPDYLRATMPVNSHTHQPMGILHGGASVALAETVGSLAANLCVDVEKYVCVGQEINANHLRPAASGLVTGTARPFHIGSKSQVWGIEIRDENEKLVCVSRLTMAVVERK
jgi:1,4-dihydroxy-2-naphthoyl-CoA hydrolase